MEAAVMKVTHEPSIYSLIEEILYCWFRYHMPKRARQQIFAILQGIFDAKQRVEFPIVGEDYIIAFEPLSDDSTSKMLITRVYPKRLKTDKRLAFMKTLIERARKKPEKKHLKNFTVELQGTSLIFTFYLFN